MTCICDFCKNNIPFVLPQEIIEATQRGDLVLFAGAGISTENNLIFKQTLYEDVFTDLVPSPKTKIDFPSLMTEFCKQINGRKLLLEKIHHRFQYCQQFQELYRMSTKFHKELSSIYSIDKIITTNWDDYFEIECNAIPIVTAEDFAFYDISSRKVFKIHGSISNYGSIVATKQDYEKCYKNLNSGLIGGYLKTLLATKVVIFVGYSFNDFDFNKVYNYLKKEMGQILPHCYIITLDKTFKQKFKTEKATIIETDGSYFFSILRNHLEGINFLIPKKNLETIELISYLRYLNHKKAVVHFFKNKTPAGIYNLFYQDGLQHAFDYLNYNSKSGLSFNKSKIIHAITAYKKMKVELIKYKNYSDLAYVEGYIYGLMSILPELPIKLFPFYYIMGLGPITTYRKFAKALKDKSAYHIAADKFGRKHYKNVLDKKSDGVPQHTAFIG